MAPNSIKSAKNSTNPSTPKNDTTNLSPDNLSHSPAKPVIRDEIFTRFDKPFGFEQHTFNLWMLVIFPSMFSLYTFSQYLTFKYPFSSVFFFCKCKTLVFILKNNQSAIIIKYRLINSYLIFNPNIAFVYGTFASLGITVGGHRYWSHKSFKANLPLQILLMCMHTISLQVID